MTRPDLSHWCSTIAVGLALLATAADAAPATPRSTDEHHSADVLVAFNQHACDMAFAEDQFLTFKGARALSMMHLAIHDALNAIAPHFRPYAYAHRDRRASPVAAAAQAAHDVLRSQYPDRHEVLAQELDAWLSRVSDPSARRRGVALGEAAARAVLARRTDDGWNTPGTYEFVIGPGEYQTTPPWDGFVLQPGFRHARPFGLERADQFRPAPPPRLAGAAYAEAFDEVRSYGRADSVTRSADQTGYAVWWMEFAEGSMNRLARDLVTAREISLWRAARLLALLNASIFDAYIATWDAKYHYNHWRPFTAIRVAAEDGNATTEPDAAWEPLRTTPPFPEYPSAHSTVCNASFEIFRRSLGDRIGFTMTSATAPPGMPTRSFASFSEAGAECADSRVRLGFHFRYATDRGLTLGRRVARHLDTHLLRPHEDIQTPGPHKPDPDPGCRPFAESRESSLPRRRSSRPSEKAIAPALFARWEGQRPREPGRRGSR